MRKFLVGALLLMMAGCARTAAEAPVPGTPGAPATPSAVSPTSVASESPGLPRDALAGVWAGRDGAFVARMNPELHLGAVSGCMSRCVDGVEQCSYCLEWLGTEGGSYLFGLRSGVATEFSCFDWDHRDAQARLLDGDQWQLEIPGGDSPETIVFQRSTTDTESCESS